jgi:FkbM family methyltransferase
MSIKMPPFGTYAPTSSQAKAIAWARKFDPGFFSKYAASLAKRMIWPSLYGPLDVMTWDIQMRLDPRRNVTEKRLLLSPSRFELEERLVLEKTLQAGDIFVDVGANVGAYTLWAAKMIGPTGKVVSIEPQPKVLARLRANVGLNPDFNVQIFPCGAGPRDGHMLLSIGSSNEGGASMATDQGGGASVEVSVRPLLDLLNEAKLDRVDALKIDIEGYEDQALIPFFASAPKKLRPKLLILERSEKDWTEDLLSTLAQIGYVTTLITKRNYVMTLKGG